ncbi:Uncharacterised protein [Segatella copri]|nr:Uncharacterised protein [Segatella copri]
MISSIQGESIGYWLPIVTRKKTPGPSTLLKLSVTNEVMSLSSCSERRMDSSFSCLLTATISLPFMIAWSCLCTSSRN